MKEVSKEDKEAMYRLITEGAEAVSDTPEKAEQYLREMGYDPEKIADEGIRRIEQIMLELEAQKAKEELAKKIKEAKESMKPWDWGKGSGDQGMER